MPAAAQKLADQRRLHLHHGPIDLIIEAFGPAEQCAVAYQAAQTRFATVLDDLVAELPLLRQPYQPQPLAGIIAQRMQDAVQPFVKDFFITPMAAVAGAVADEILLAMTTAAQLDKAYVNNGGDIAVHLTATENFAIGLVAKPAELRLAGNIAIQAKDGIRGIATSGRHGRSLSLGIADSVTVLADCAAGADAAATLIANAVDLPEHAAIERAPANSIDLDSDLGDRLVTVNVGRLGRQDIEQALQAGLQLAQKMRQLGLIQAVALTLCGEVKYALC